MLTEITLYSPDSQ